MVVIVCTNHGRLVKEEDEKKNKKKKKEEKKFECRISGGDILQIRNNICVSR